MVAFCKKKLPSLQNQCSVGATDVVGVTQNLHRSTTWANTQELNIKQWNGISGLTDNVVHQYWPDDGNGLHTILRVSLPPWALVGTPQLIVYLYPNSLLLFNQGAAAHSS